MRKQATLHGTSYLPAASQERKHFGAMYSQTYSHRDIPMRNEQVLQVLMQTSEMQTAVEEWGA